MAYIHKTNKSNKQSDRVIVITEYKIYKLDNVKFKLMKKGIPITEITGLSVSPGKDQLIVIHSNRGNDFIFAINAKENRIGEIVGVLCNRYYQ